MESQKKLNIKSIAWYVLIAYFCLYEITLGWMHFDKTTMNLVVLAVITFSACLYLMNIFVGMRSFNAGGFVWLPFLLVLINQAKNYAIAKSYIMLFALFMLMIFFPISKEDLWESALKAIRIMAIFSAVGVFVHILFPPLHALIISTLYSGEGVAYINSYTSNGYYSGFLHQVGVSAWYIAVGIVLEIFGGKKNSKKVSTIIFLGLALVMQGKRSLFIFLIVTICITYIIMGNQLKKVTRFMKIAVFMGVMIIILSEISASLSEIKLFEKLAYTIEYLMEGNTAGLMERSGREHLYELAWKLYDTNPVFGIGWAEFSKVVEKLYVNATSVHNIYLQLLCETGIVGVASFALGAAVSLIKTLSAKRLIDRYDGEDKNKYEKIFMISLSGQILFLLFGIVENPLYNENCLIFYFLMIVMGISLQSVVKRRIELKVSPDAL